MATFNGTKEECEELARILDKLDGGPKRGVHVGGGRHVDMPLEWDGTGDVPPGWTSHKGRVRYDEDALNYVLTIDDESWDRLSTDELQRLTAALSPVVVPSEPTGEMRSLLSTTETPVEAPTKTSNIITPGRVAVAVTGLAALAEIAHQLGLF